MLSSSCHRAYANPVALSKPSARANQPRGLKTEPILRLQWASSDVNDFLNARKTCGIVWRKDVIADVSYRALGDGARRVVEPIRLGIGNENGARCSLWLIYRSFSSMTFIV
jgi:hypothetical protein